MPKSLQPMTPDEFRAGLKDIGYSQEGFAELIGSSARTGQKWALGEARVPNCVAILLRLFTASPKALKAVEAMEPLPPHARAPAKRSKRACGGRGTMRETKTYAYRSIDDDFEEAIERRVIIGEACPVCRGRGLVGRVGG